MANNERVWFVLTCKETQAQIVAFIQGDLGDEDSMRFIDHVHNCSVCMEEYEVYYTLLTGMKMLKEDQEDASSFVVDSVKNLDKIQDGLIKKKVAYIRRRVVFLFWHRKLATLCTWA